MHLLFTFVLLFGVCGTALAFLLLTTRIELEELPSLRRRLRVAFGISAAIPVLLVALLAFAQGAVCDVLGGDWVLSEQSCRNEWGGNGSNDPSNWAWEVPDPVE